MMRHFFILLISVFLLSSCEDMPEVDPVNTEQLSDEDIVKGLKEALKVGTDTSVNLNSKVDGYYKNAFIKILFPPEAQKVEKTLRDIGMGSLVDDVILSLNRAAEDAAIEAKPIFVDAITSMSIEDGKNILFGDSVAATTYLNGKTYSSLKTTFMPKIKASLDKVQATKYWADVFNTYNALPTTFNKINPDLDEYATSKALDGLFYMVAQEEQNIRKDPVARVNDILQKVFGELDK